jgi:predicted PurR-regulated permease PerM
MSDSQVLPAESQAAETAVEVVATRSNARFRPMSAPSAPFWLLIIAGVVGLTVLTLSWSVIFMFGIGLAVFAVLLPIVNWLDRRGLNRGIAALAAVAITVAIFIVIVIAGIAVFFNQILPFIAAIPDTLAKIQAEAPPGVASAIQSILDSINSATADMDQGTIALGFLKGALGMVGTVLSLAVLPFFIFYMLIDQPKMANGFRSGIPGPWRSQVDAAINIFRNDFVNYFRAEIIVGSIQGTIVFIGTFIIGLIVGPPFQGFAIFLGVLAGVMELLPQIGPIISLIPALLLALATSPLAVVLVSVFYVIDFIVEANVLVPKIEGQVINFRAAFVLLIVMVGLAIGGIVGAILALPVAAIVRDMFRYLFVEAERSSIVELDRAKSEAALD